MRAVGGPSKVKAEQCDRHTRPPPPPQQVFVPRPIGTFPFNVDRTLDPAHSASVRLPESHFKTTGRFVFEAFSTYFIYI